jgi:glycerol-3-phosphate dehydrogenase (NAD(P)+)
VNAKPTGDIQRVVVVGDGGWGTAMAILLAMAGRQVSLWTHDEAYGAVLSESRANPRFLPGFEIPATVRVSADLSTLLSGCDLLVSAVPTEFLRIVWSGHAAHLPAGLPILSLTKGLEAGTDLRPTQVLRELTGARPLGVLSGPNIAREIARGLPAATVVACDDSGLAQRVQASFSSDKFRVYRNPDLAGVELGGALKNVIAIAAGLCDGLELGENAKAALVDRGVKEIARLGERLGGQRRTFFGLSGLGDLMTTCYSRVSRNRTFGERLGRGEAVSDIKASMKQVAEGVKTSVPVHDLMQRHGLALPISEEVYQVIHHGKAPRETVRSLMLRGPKDEAEDLL